MAFRTYSSRSGKKLGLRPDLEPTRPQSSSVCARYGVRERSVSQRLRVLVQKGHDVRVIARGGGPVSAGQLAEFVDRANHLQKFASPNKLGDRVGHRRRRRQIRKTLTIIGQLSRFS